MNAFKTFLLGCRAGCDAHEDKMRHFFDCDRAIVSMYNAMNHLDVEKLRAIFDEEREKFGEDRLPLPILFTLRELHCDDEKIANVINLEIEKGFAQFSLIEAHEMEEKG